MDELTLTGIFIYPVKSLGGIALDRAPVKNKGLAFDRRWMLIDRSGVAMTQRSYPEMALFRPHIDNGTLTIRYTRGEKILSSCDFDLSMPPVTETIGARVWDDEVAVREVEPSISKWFTHHLGAACKLVAFPEENPRPVNPKYSVGERQVSLADAYPFLIIGQSSLDDLNRRLVEPVPMNRFRPNFVFTGGAPYEEDGWRNFAIGRIPFVGVKNSDRCVLTTVNQDTAERGTEPLRTLSMYRKIENKVYFGQNIIALKQGEVAVGDPVIPG